MEKEKFPLKNIVEENILLFDSIIKSKNLHITDNINSNTMVNCDKNMMSTIIRNLFSNAVKFTGAEGKIDVRAGKQKTGKVLFEITDTGSGITKEDILKLFMIDGGYVREGTEKEKGSGLGLILCKEFVEMNGGAISVESELNKGTSVKLTFPG